MQHILPMLFIIGISVLVYKYLNNPKRKARKAAELAHYNEEVSKLNILEREQLAAIQSKSTTSSWVGAFLLMGPIGLMMNSSIQKSKAKKARAKLGL